MAKEEVTQTGETNPTGASGLVPGDDFSEDYANNFNFEFSEWDFKIIFGQLDRMRSAEQQSVNWHTSITMPWGAAFILSYYLQLNMLAYELSNGPILLAQNVIPAVPPVPSGEQDNPLNRKFHELAADLHERHFGGRMRPAPPDVT